MRIFSKILNPEAKIANVALALIYIAVFACLFAGAMMWQFSGAK